MLTAAHRATRFAASGPPVTTRLFMKKRRMRPGKLLSYLGDTGLEEESILNGQLVANFSIYPQVVCYLLLKNEKLSG